MTLWVVQANLKARDDVALGRFWAAALGWSASSARPGATSVAPAGFTWPDPNAFALDIVAVPDPGQVRHRAHLDLATTSAAHQASLVGKLLDLGAEPADIGQGDVPWTVLRDPEGNLFCVLEPRETYRDTGPLAAVVVDCADPRAMARFWASATDGTVLSATDSFARLRSARGVGPYLEFMRTPGGGSTAGKRVHLDVAPYLAGSPNSPGGAPNSPGGSQSAAVARLRALGATDADVGQGDDVSWTVLADPEGNEFCVLAVSW